jgi:AcrR family transcriptional regulator
MATTDTTSLDGRRLRRDRNRDAVVEALLALHREGNAAPSADEIAARAGISARSLFRYFDDVDALVRAAIAHQQERLAPLFVIDLDPDEPVAARIEAFVAQRVRLLEAMGPVGRLARSVAARQPLVAEELTRIRAGLRAQLASAFAPELATLDPADGASTLAALDVLLSWESYDLLRNDQGLTAMRAADTMAAALRTLLRAGTHH